MPLEIEIKLKVDNHAPIRDCLQSLGAQPHGTVRETNIFFDDPSRSLRTRGSGLRVRFSHQPNNPTPTALLTFKGPAATAGLDSREAFDLTLTPHDQIVPLLLALGYQQILLFEKDRESWKLDNCLVELDTLPHLGFFVEIEGPSEQMVKDVQSKLNLSDIPQHQPSYSRMAAHWCELQSYSKPALRF